MTETKVGGLTVRPYRPEDLDELLALNAYGLSAAGIRMDEDYYAGEDIDDLQQTYSETAGGCMLVGDTEGKIVAMGGIRRLDKTTAELLRMRVYPEYQGRGYGRVILSLLEREARRLGYRRVQLITGENQHRAVDLYSRHGYHITGRENLIGIPSLHMSKDLQDDAPEVLPDKNR